MRIKSSSQGEFELYLLYSLDGRSADQRSVWLDCVKPQGGSVAVHRKCAFDTRPGPSGLTSPSFPAPKPAPRMMKVVPTPAKKMPAFDAMIASPVMRHERRNLPCVPA